MTDGILLAELQRDRACARYDTIIVDEAHERSLNIDFILGYLTQLLPRRPDLKVIITSATIDTERFAKHFDAPVIEVSGRTYPVEVRYRPLGDEADEPDRLPARPTRSTASGPRSTSCAARARATCWCSSAASARSATPPPPSSEARLRRHRGPPPLRPPVGRRAAAGVPAPPGPAGRAGHQRGRDVDHRARRPLRRRRRARPASRATTAGPRSSACRSSRSARPPPTSGPGAAAGWRRASASASTPRTTTRPGPSSPSRRSCAPTWRRSSCRWRRCGLGDVESFPFVDPPDARSIRDAVALLVELGAIDRGRPHASPSSAGGSPASPSTPGSGGWSSRPTACGCVREVLVIAAALSIQDVRGAPDRPGGRRPPRSTAASPTPTATSRPCSTCGRTWRPSARRGASSQFRKMCQARVPQPPAGARVAGPGTPAAAGRPDMGIAPQRGAGDGRRRPPRAAGRAAVAHRPLDREARDYVGARQARFAIARARRCTGSRRRG